MRTDEELPVDPGTIAVGVDGSPSSGAALDWALEQARLEGRSVTVVHAVHPLTPVLLEPGAPDAAAAHRQGLLLEGRRLLDQVRREVGSGQASRTAVVVHELVRVGDPREVLREVSANAAMVVVGSRGRGPLRSMLLGSTAVSLVRRAACPVVVHRGALPPRRAGIAVGVDDSQGSLAVLGLAFDLAHLHHEPLTVVHAQHFRPSTPTDDPYAEPAWAESEHVDVAAAVEDLLREHPEVTVSSVIRHDTPGGLLLDLADEMRLLVVGVHRRGRMAELTFGATAVWLVEHASCPVAVVPLAPVTASTPTSAMSPGERTAGLS